MEQIFFFFFNDRYIYRKSKFLSSIFQCVQPFAGDRKQDTRKLDHLNWNFVSSLNEANIKCYKKEEQCLKLQKHLLVSYGAFHPIAHPCFIALLVLLVEHQTHHHQVHLPFAPDLCPKNLLQVWGWRYQLQFLLWVDPILRFLL